MNKKQLIILWIGALVFLFCLLNPEIVPYTRYDTEFKKYSDREWNRELSKYGLSLANLTNLPEPSNTIEMMNDKSTKFDMGEFLAKSDYNSTKNEYIKMLKKGERPHHLEIVKTNPTICFERPFKSSSDALLARVLGVTALTALFVYSCSDKNKDTFKEILRSITVFKSQK